MIDHLRKLYTSKEVAVVYYYSSWNEEQVQTPIHFASTVLRQLCSKLDFIPTSVNEFYLKTKNEVKDEAWFTELQNILHRVVKTFLRCFLIIDALDELPTQQRAKLLDVVRGTSDAVPSRVLRVFATSRPHLSFPKFSFRTIEIAAHDQDVRALVSGKIDEHPDADHILDARLKQQVIDKLCSNAHGMFLLPALQIDELLSNDTKAVSDLFPSSSNMESIVPSSCLSPSNDDSLD